jgi:two-component system, sensor histidine kinase and response regulator
VLSPSRSLRWAKPDILIVDDTLANLQVLTGLLQARGYKVRPVPNGRLALQATRNMAPDLILLDIKMPEMDGFEVCRLLKSDPQLAEIPVIFLSALSETADKIQAFGAGGVDYITKPFQIEEVEARVQTHVRLKRLQKELEDQNEHLEDLVQERTLQLAESNERLAGLDKAKGDFLKLISHELRTPLSGVIGIAELAFRECGEQPMALKLRELFDQARNRLIGLVEDALLLTDIELRPDFAAADTCSLSPVLQDALEQTEALARSRSVRLPETPAVPQSVRGRTHLMVRTLRSLLETAVKFTAEGQSVQCRIEGDEAVVRITIKATGRSIPPDSLTKFFDVLAISDSITPGADLGLAPAVAERLVAAFGGKLRVENVDPPGIRFFLELPVA